MRVHVHVHVHVHVLVCFLCPLGPYPALIHTHMNEWIGLFATAPLRKGELVLVFTGKVVPLPDFVAAGERSMELSLQVRGVVVLTINQPTGVMRSLAPFSSTDPTQLPKTSHSR